MNNFSGQLYHFVLVDANAWQISWHIASLEFKNTRCAAPTHLWLYTCLWPPHPLPLSTPLPPGGSWSFVICAQTSNTAGHHQLQCWEAMPPWIVRLTNIVTTLDCFWDGVGLVDCGMLVTMFIGKYLHHIQS